VAEAQAEVSAVSAEADVQAEEVQAAVAGVPVGAEVVVAVEAADVDERHFGGIKLTIRNRKRIIRILIAMALLPILVLALFGCGGEIPTDAEVSSYLKRRYNVTEYEIVDSGYDIRHFEASNINYGYVIVNIQGVEIKISSEDFGGRSDNYWTKVEEGHDLTEYISQKYGNLPEGISLKVEWPNSRRWMPRHFPVAFEEMVEYNKISVTYIGADIQTITNNVKTLVSLRKSAKVTDETQIQLETQGTERYSPIYFVLKNGKIVCLDKDFAEYERQPGVEYPYIDDSKLLKLRAAGADEEKINKRIEKIGKELRRIGYQ
jgi:hypothetical protein